MGERDRETEWPTVALLVLFAVAWAAVVLSHRTLPTVVEGPLLALLGGFHMSLQHELLHGHPSRRTWLNTLLGFVPLSLYLPYLRYKQLHTLHHRTDLTHPLLDPESFYITEAAWQRASRPRRMLIIAHRSLLGRLLLGTPRAICWFVADELRHVGRDAVVTRQWFVHLGGAAAVGWWLFAVVDYPWPTYLAGFVVGGYMFTQLRSFAEHRAVAVGTRSAVVRSGRLMSLMYLNNNLHHTHHAEPALAWYRIPALHRQLGSDELAAEGAGFYRGYAELFRRHLLRPFCQPIDPLLRTQGDAT
jgi:fatty acid desaturase